MSRVRLHHSCAFALALAIGAVPLFAAVPAATPKAAADEYQHLRDAANAAVGLKVKALANARSNRTLGQERAGSGVIIADNLVLTIGYLILEADQVDVTTNKGRTVPATVAAYDHATGFGLVRTVIPLGQPAIRMGSSGKIDPLDRLLVAASGGEDTVSVATVVSRRPFAGYWEYLIEGAIFTSPPRADFGGASLINKDGELVGIGSLFVMDAVNPGEKLPGNMFVPIDLLKPILEEMVSTGGQKGGRRPWLGINSLEDDGRIKVMRVTADSPAEQAGIAPGDIILGLSGEKV
jgi:serine protease Do